MGVGVTFAEVFDITLKFNRYQLFFMCIIYSAKIWRFPLNFTSLGLGVS